MKTLIVVVVLALAVSQGWIMNTDEDSGSECPTVWSYRSPGSNHCECGQTLGGGIMCSKGEVYMRVDYTMTLDPSTNETVAAPNVYGFDNYSAIVDRVYTPLPHDSQHLNQRICAPNNRTGFLCEECIDGFGPTAYYSACMNCSEHSLVARVAGFMALKLVPITVMFVLLVLFRINVTHGPIFGYIIFCQGLTMAVRLLMPFHNLVLNDLGEKRNLFNILLFVSAFWDMNYAPLFGTTCISPSLNNIDVLLLNFVSAFYPLLLVVFSYVSIELHDHNFRLLVLLWKPFRMCLLKFRKDWDVKGSIIYAYAMLFCLSFSSLNFDAYMALKSTNVFTINRSLETVLLYQPSINFHKRQFILYLLIILLLMLVLGVIPTVLLCVQSIRPMRRRFNDCCPHRAQIILFTFVDNFQGMFRDKFRVMPAVFTTSVMLVVFIGAFGDTVNLYIGVSIYIGVLMVASFLTAFIRPFKCFITNVSVSFHLLLLSGMSLLASHYILDVGGVGSSYPVVLLCFCCIPHLLMFLWVLFIVLNKIGCIKLVRMSVLGLDESREGLLPDRLENSYAYRELSASTCRRSTNAQSRTH